MDVTVSQMVKNLSWVVMAKLVTVLIRSVKFSFEKVLKRGVQICKKYHNCQRCINKDYNDCPEWAPYKYKGRTDPSTGQKYLECLNKESGRISKEYQLGDSAFKSLIQEGSCRRNHCECDKRLAEQLAEYELAWNPEYR